MKKLLTVLLTAMTALCLLAGCAEKAEPSASPSPSPTAPAVSPTPTVSAATEPDTAKTGLGVVNSIAKSKDAGDSDGIAQVDSSAAAVLIGPDGKIISCVIDQVQTKITFDKAGSITTPLDTGFKTKNELADEYGMKKASDIGKEWYEQAAAFAGYVEGKTIDEIKGIAVDESGHPEAADLTSSVTIAIGDLVSVIEKAVNNASDKGAGAADKLSLSIVTNINKSSGASEKEGLAQAYSTYVAVTTDDSGKITSCAIDASQSNVNFDASGKITSDLSFTPPTKNELGDEYGMKKASDIGKEWYEQAEAFADYVVGKTADDVRNIAIDEAGHPTGPDITSSVTVSIGDFKAAISKKMQ
jgi:hypothetical protein